MSVDTSYLHGQFSWNECGTSDQEGGKAFYTGLFGWTAVDREMPGDMGGTYTIFQHHGKDVCGLYQMAGPMFEGVPPHWMAYVNVESADAVAEEVTTQGGEVVGPAIDVPGVGRIAMFKDPQGAHLAVFQAGDHKGAGHSGNAIGAFCWNEVMTTDAEAATAFYTSIFPWSASSMEMPGGMQYTMLTLGEAPAAGLMQMGAEFAGAPPHWMSYVAVEDCDATVASATGLGGTVCVPATDIPNVGRFAVLTDPQGATFSVIKLANAPC